MSLTDFKAALDAAKPRRFVFVSDALFWELYDALELSPQRHSWRPPQDPDCKKVLDALLANQQLPRTDHIEEITWHLMHHKKIRVVRCVAVKSALADTGPGSFEFY